MYPEDHGARAPGALPAGVEMESVPCPLGCMGGDRFVLEGRDRLHGLPGLFRVVRCRECGLLRTDPRPTRQAISFYYPEDYGPYLGTRARDVSGTRTDGRGWRAWIKGLMETRTTWLPPCRPGRLLEIGCASGAFLLHMVSLGWEVAGIEPSPSASAAARSLGFPVFTGSVEDAPEPLRSLDLVVGWMVLEHLHDPVPALESIHRWLVPGGWLVLSVPDAGALEFRLFKERWYALHLPNHLYHFVPDTLKRLLRHTGFEIVRLCHQRSLGNLFGSLGHWAEDRLGGGLLARSLSRYPETASKLPFLLFPLAFALAGLGQTGRMTLWARRTPHD